MTGPEPAYSPRKMLITISIAVAITVLLSFLIAYAAGRAHPQPAHVRAHPTPAPQPTWTTYIPTTPQACRDMADSANDLVVKSAALHKADLDVTSLAAQGKYDQAHDKIATAKKANEAYNKAIEDLRAQAKKCQR